jgi:uncharacterized protein (TIGR02217 family)
MSGFKEIQFPPKVSFGAVGGLSWLTVITGVESGQEQRQQVLAQPLGRWEVAHAARRQADYELVRAHFNNVRGRAYGFRFKDWTDYTVSAAESHLSDSDGSPTQKQLAKAYTFGSEIFYRKLTKIVAGTFVATGGSGLSLDYTNGILQYSSLPTSFSCEFDVPARYDTDEMRAETIDKGRDGFIIGWSSIPIVAIRV